jgi:hypothetical protein
MRKTSLGLSLLILPFSEGSNPGPFATFFTIQPLGQTRPHKEYVSFINKNYIAVLRRLRSIAQHTAITLTYKIKAAGSQRLGEVMVLVLFFVVLCWLCVIA